MKKILCTLLAAILCVTTVACGGGASSTSTSASSVSEASSEAPSATSAITYWSMWNNNEPQGVVIQEAAAAFEAQTGVKVNIEWKGRDINTVIQAALDSKEKIDLFDEDFQRVGTQYYKDLYNLEDMAKAVGYDDFAVAALPTAIRGWAGSLVAIPYQPYTSGVFYNKAAFTAAGITAEPNTWEEFLDVCEKLKAAGYTPLAQDDAYVRYTFGFILARLVGQDGVKEICNNGDWAENPAVEKAAAYIVELREKGYLSATAPDAYPEGENEIGFDLAAMVVNASWVPGEITNNTDCDLEWGMFNFPSFTDGKDPATVANIGAQAFAIPAYSENAQAAFDFVMLLTSGEFDQKMALDSNGIPADTRNAEWPEMIAGVRDAFNAQTDVYDWNMGLNENADMKETIQENCLKLFEGSLDAAGFVAAMESAS